MSCYNTMDFFIRLLFIIATLHYISPSIQQASASNLDLSKSFSSNNKNKQKQESSSDRKHDNSFETSFTPKPTKNSQTPVSSSIRFQQSNLNPFQTEQRNNDKNQSSSRSSSSSSFKNRVREGAPSIAVTKPIVHGSISRNTSVILECFIDSYPASSNFWLNGDFETIKNTSGKYYITEDLVPNYEYRYRLRLHFMEITDEVLSQKFWCLSYNIYGTEKGQVRVEVSEHLVTSSIPTNGIVHAKRGTDVELACSVQGYPFPITYWFKGDTGYQLISNSKYTVLEEYERDKFQYISRLKINSIGGREFISYRCVTKNSVSETQHVFVIQEVTISKAKEVQTSAIGSIHKKIRLLNEIIVFLCILFSCSLQTFN